MKPSVVLVSMPWAPIPEPSLGLAILAAQLRHDAIPVCILHANTSLLKYVTHQTYAEVAGYWGLNEFVFTELLSPGVDDRQLSALVDRCALQAEGHACSQKYSTPELLLEMLLRFRGEVALDYLAEVAAEVVAHQPTLVGFTCMFDQTMASVALAKLIKAAAPDTLIVFGGYALEGAPGAQMVRAFEWIDGVCRGDGEQAITSLACASVGECELASIPGIITRKGGTVPAEKVDLRLSPHPDYTDWFSTLDALKQEGSIEIRTGALPVESSRGCWWGQHKHCIFCGIDEDTLHFRFKPAAQTLGMLRQLRREYGDHTMRFSDYIFPRAYFRELLPALAEEKPRYHLHCELKSNQSKEAIAALAQAGFEEVQPGIESFSSDVLKLMDKGVSGMQNVFFLKLGYLERIVVHYNFIYGFPGEKLDWYERMIEQIPSLYHLTPPVARTEAIITRFAPLQANTMRFGISKRPVHHRCYDTLFSKDFLISRQFSLDDYAYYFERHFEPEGALEELYAQIVMQINHWKHQHRTRDVRLEYDVNGDSLSVLDTRFSSEPRRIELRGPERAAYLLCDDRPVSVDRVIQAVASSTGCSPIRAQEAVAELEESRLLWREDEIILGLAVPSTVADERIQSKWKHRWAGVFK